MKVQSLRTKLREATAVAILDAAEHVAAEQGVSNASLHAIAERAGIAVGTIYNYFHDKLGLIDALFKRRREELFAAMDETAKKHARAPFSVQLEAFVGAVFSFFDARREFLRIGLETEPRRPKVVPGKDGSSPTMQQLRKHADRVVRVGLREKRLREDGADLLPIILVSIVRGVLVARAQGDDPFAAEAARVVSIFLAGAAK
jgi:AcrR family transcriptional regulator